MKPVYQFILLLCFSIAWHASSVAQPSKAELLRERVKRLAAKTGYQKDTAWLNAVNLLGFYYAENFPDSALVLLANHPQMCKDAGYEKAAADAYKITGNAYQIKGDFKKAMEFFQRAYDVAQKINYKTGLPSIISNIGLAYMNQGNYTAALKHLYEALQKEEEGNNNPIVIGRTWNNIGIIHYFQGKLTEAKADYEKLLKNAVAVRDTENIVLAYNNIGEVFLDENNLPAALNYFKNSFNAAKLAGKTRALVSCTKNLGLVYYRMDSLTLSADYFKQAAAMALQNGYKPAASVSFTKLANTQFKMNLLDDALASGEKALQMAEQMGQAQLIRDASEVVANVYEAKGNGMQAIKHYKVYKQYADSLRNFESERTAERLKAEFDFSKKELEFERKTLQQRWLIFSSFAAFLTALLVVLLVYRSRQKEKKANNILQQKNITIEQQKQIAEDALHQLQATQNQLIQAEKMASLGEMTAGIAHEIQNPLNFVNNFSEVSTELVKEMVEEVDNGNTEEVKVIANDLVQNLEKINHHGKRAADIVKSMLQHSRSGSGAKEPTDINTLCDEYLRLAYQGLRAKDKSFNARFQSSFDPGVENINVVQQDIGRVVLNLINNAFYAVSEKKKNAGDDYEPTVKVSTLKKGNSIEIKVTDNGTGIPQKAIDKIFQPFFTTKPTGEGTGLGLSLSYDIVKAHGGELKVETKEGEGSEFVISLPVV
ncbi:MAG: tetratricopeptide repeat protein [Lacibacter sp.]